MTLSLHSDFGVMGLLKVHYTALRRVAHLDYAKGSCRSTDRGDLRKTVVKQNLDFHWFY